MMKNSKRYSINPDYQEPWEEYFCLPFHIDYDNTIRDAYEKLVFEIVDEDISEDSKTVMIMKINGHVGFITRDNEWTFNSGYIDRNGKPCLVLKTANSFARGIGWKEAAEAEKGVAEYVLRQLKKP